MNIKEHFKHRYCERVLGIKDEKEILAYIAQNQQRLSEECLRLFEHSKLIWKGCINDNIVRNFYVSDYWIIVTDTNNSTLVTIYQVDFGFPSKTNLKVAKDLIGEVEKLNKEFNKAQIKAQSVIEAKKMEAENVNRQIAYIEDQARILRQKGLLITEEIKQINAEPFLIQRDVDKYATQLCNSISLKYDLQKIK